MRDPVAIEGVGTITCDVPDLIYDAVIASLKGYDKGESDFTVTELIAPPQTKALARTKWQEITIPASRFLYRMWGTQVHENAEKGASSKAVVETRFYMPILGCQVGVKIDHWEDGVLSDVKTLSAYEGKRHATPKSAKPEKVQQLNASAHILRFNNMLVDRLQIVALVRDWRPSESLREKGYPNQAIAYDLPMWDEAECQDWLEERVRLHRAAREGDVVECAPSERWLRNGRPVRCTSYCDVASVCPQHAAHLNPTA